MAKKQSPVTVAFVVELIEHSFRKKSWHGAILNGSLRGVDAQEALWRPSEKRHSIWEIVLHCAYWKFRVARRFTPGKKDKFPRQGSDWFAVSYSADEKSWKSDKKLLKNTHQELIEAVKQLTNDELIKTPPGSKINNLDILFGIAYHDIYHAGQIQLLKRLHDS
ncbi:MAG: hypothetical protein GF404_04475 [candidate division Zixibacteria bacterium]|nr:hypothetical protein [candidate division Zixibacteria bacterium]